MKNSSVILLLGVFVPILEKDVSLHLMAKIIDFSHEARKYMIIIMKAAAHIISINSGILKQLYRFCNNIASLLYRCIYETHSYI